MESRGEEKSSQVKIILYFRFLINAVVGTMVTLFAATAMLIYVIVPQMHAKQEHKTVVSCFS